VDVRGMADEIRGMGGEFSDPDDVHNYLVNVHDLISALQENLYRSGEQLSEMGVHQRYPEAVQEAGASLSGIAEELEAITSGGVMQGPGG
jgi:hypothetical protein